MIEISSNIIETISNALSNAIISLWPVIAVLLGLVVGFFIVRKIIFIISLTKR